MRGYDVSMLSFNVLLAALRDRYSQAEAATAIGCHRNTISRWERGDGVPSVDELARLCDYYGVTDEQRLAILRAAAGVEVAP